MKNLILLSTVLGICLLGAALTSDVARVDTSLESSESATAAKAPNSNELPIAIAPGSALGESANHARIAEPPLTPELNAGRLAPPTTDASARLHGRITSTGNAQFARLSFTTGPNKGTSFATDVEGNFDSPNLYPGFGHLAVEVVGMTCTREVRLRSQLDESFALDFGSFGAVRGVVLDPQGMPLFGALVSLDGNVVASDAYGQFALPRNASGTALLQVESAGFVPFCQRIAETDTRALEIQLEVGARLELSISTVAGGDGEALVYLFPTAGERLSGNRVGSAYPWHELNPIRTRSGARLVLEDLPQTRVDVHVLHSGARGSQAGTWLTPETVARIDVELEAVERVDGRLSRNGEPLAFASVYSSCANPLRATLQALEGGARFLLSQPIELMPGVAQVARTDAEGRFSLARWEEKRLGVQVTVTHGDSSWRCEAGDPTMGELTLLLDPSGQPRRR